MKKIQSIQRVTLISVFLLIQSSFAGGIGDLPWRVVIPKKGEIVNTYNANSTAEVSNTFKVLVWNLYKGDNPDFEAKVFDEAGKYDIEIFQEVTDKKTFDPILHDKDYNSIMANSFIYNEGIKAGVATRSKFNRTYVHGYHPVGREPMVKTPKAALITNYRIENSEQTLMVVNIHAINFVLIDVFANFMKDIYHQVKDHKGPMIFAGDFNTWAPNRNWFLQKIAKKLNLKFSKYDLDVRKKFFGYELDHILYRGLKLNWATSKESLASDHNPLMASFSLLK
tara:strand:- start:122749 stop:123591 length:843 start_codon:yes stop_codon:yes gene_type:complete